MGTEELHNFIIRIDASLEQEGLPSYTDVVSMMNALRFYAEHRHIDLHNNIVKEAKEMCAKFDRAVQID